MRKRIVFVVGTLGAGGIERSVTDWCEFLVDKTDWQPVVICLLKKAGPFLSVLENRGIRTEECKVHNRWFTLRFTQLLKDIQPEVVHSQVAFSMPWQVLAMRCAGSRRIISTQQNEYQNWKPWGARLRLKFYFFLFFRFIYQYTCVSEKVRDSLCLLLKLEKSKFLVIPNSVDTTHFFPSSPDRGAIRGQLGVSPDCFLIGMVGRFSPQKGHVYLLEAVEALKRRRIDCKILLVGGGELENGMKKFVRERELDDYVVFYGQAVNVNQVLNGLDCFVLPSLWEGMPLALLEAMAVGVPVIGTDVAGTREVVGDSQNGLLIPSKSSSAIANAIMKLIDEPVLRRALAENARELVRNNYSVESSMASYLELYES